jgi:hypothetical protein
VEKIATAKSCLETAFADVRDERSSEHHRFVFHDRGHSTKLIFTLVFLAHIRPEQLAWFREHMTSQVIPLVKAKAGKRIFISDHGIDVSERESP